MSVKIRLARRGRKKLPVYKIIVADSRSPRDGKFLEAIGTYQPLLADQHKDRIILKLDRLKYWVSCGALMTDRVASLVKKYETGVKNG